MNEIVKHKGEYLIHVDFCSVLDPENEKYRNAKPEAEMGIGDIKRDIINIDVIFCSAKQKHVNKYNYPPEVPEEIKPALTFIIEEFDLSVVKNAIYMDKSGKFTAYSVYPDHVKNNTFSLAFNESMSINPQKSSTLEKRIIKYIKKKGYTFLPESSSKLIVLEKYVLPLKLYSLQRCLENALLKKLAKLSTVDKSTLKLHPSFIYSSMYSKILDYFAKTKLPKSSTDIYYTIILALVNESKHWHRINSYLNIKNRFICISTVKDPNLLRRTFCNYCQEVNPTWTDSCVELLF